MIDCAIKCNITGEWLAEYDGVQAIEWDADNQPEKLAIFTSEEEAQKAVAIISQSFLANGYDVDFSIVRVILVKPRSYYERVR